MKTIGAVAGATGVLAALGGEFLATATAVSIGLAGVLAVLLLVLAIGSLGRAQHDEHGGGGDLSPRDRPTVGQLFLRMAPDWVQ